MKKEVKNTVFFLGILTIILLGMKYTTLHTAAEKSQLFIEPIHTRNETAASEPCVSAPSTSSEAVGDVWSGTASLLIPPDATGLFKTYMDWKTITRQTSKQWHLQQLCYTDKPGFRRFNDDYLVALGTYYFDCIGERFLITLSSGRFFTATVGEEKADKDTDPTHRFSSHGNIVEFIIDDEVMDPAVLLSGDISSLGFQGDVISIRRIS